MDTPLINIISDINTVQAGPLFFNFTIQNKSDRAIVFNLNIHHRTKTTILQIHFISCLIFVLEIGEI